MTKELKTKPAAKTVKPARVQRVIAPPHPDLPEKAEIAVEGADHLYRELRIENTLADGNGKEVKLKEGAKVDVVVEADAQATVPKNGRKRATEVPPRATLPSSD